MWALRLLVAAASRRCSMGGTPMPRWRRTHMRLPSPARDAPGAPGLRGRVPGPASRPDRANWLCLARSPAGNADLPTGTMPGIGFVSRRRPAAGLSAIHNPKSAIEKLALFFRGPAHGQSLITPFPSNTSPSFRSRRIGFVSHVLAARPRPVPHCRRLALPAHAWEIGFVWRDRYLRRCRPLGPTLGHSSAWKLALFFRGPVHGQFVITPLPPDTCP